MKTTRRGFTLLEVIVAIGIVALLSVLIYGAFHGMSRSRQGIKHVSDRYQQGRGALDRMAQELSGAFISKHGANNANLSSSLAVRKTAFIGKSSGGAARVDFTAFANQVLRRSARESDQAEVSYFLANNETRGQDLVRRLDKHIDDDPSRGGVIEIVAENVESFDLSYLDPLTNEWLKDWDTTQAAGQLDRLPAQVWIVVVLADGPGGTPITFQTKVPLPMQLPLTFANSN